MPPAALPGLGFRRMREESRNISGISRERHSLQSCLFFFLEYASSSIWLVVRFGSSCHSSHSFHRIFLLVRSWERTLVCLTRHLSLYSLVLELERRDHNNKRWNFTRKSKDLFSSL
jgi:hypothetical protein